jgi:hypothetical protein
MSARHKPFNIFARDELAAGDFGAWDRVQQSLTKSRRVSQRILTMNMLVACVSALGLITAVALRLQGPYKSLSFAPMMLILFGLFAWQVAAWQRYLRWGDTSWMIGASKVPKLEQIELLLASFRDGTRTAVRLDQTGAVHVIPPTLLQADTAAWLLLDQPAERSAALPPLRGITTVDVLVEVADKELIEPAPARSTSAADCESDGATVYQRGEINRSWTVFAVAEDRLLEALRAAHDHELCGYDQNSFYTALAVTAAWSERPFMSSTTAIAKPAAARFRELQQEGRIPPQARMLEGRCLDRLIWEETKPMRRVRQRLGLPDKPAAMIRGNKKAHNPAPRRNGGNRRQHTESPNSSAAASSLG